MPDAYNEDKTVALINHINAAITNIRLYPPTSALITNSVERLNTAFEEVFDQTASLVYAESGKNLLIQGEVPAEKTQKKPQLQAFLKMLMDMGIKSLTFEQGLTPTEITAFLQLMGDPPEDAKTAEKLQKQLDQQQITHIRIDEKIYVERDDEQSIVAGLDLSDADIARAVFGAQSVSDSEMARIREMAKNPQWLSRVFQSGVHQVIASELPQTDRELPEQLTHMMDALDALSASNRSEILQSIAQSMAEVSDDGVFGVLARNVGALFGRDQFQEMAAVMDEAAFKKIYQHLVQMIQADPTGADPSLRQTLELMGKAGRLRKHAASELPKSKGGPGEKAGENAAFGPNQQPNQEPNQEPEKQQEKIKNSLNQLLKGDAAIFPELAGAAGMEQAMASLAKKGRAKTLAALGDRLLEGLQSKSAEVRESAASVLAVLDQSLAENERMTERVELSKKLLGWVRQKTEISRDFEVVSQRLQKTAESLIRSDRFREAASILEAYQLQAGGNLSKDEAIQALSANLLQNLATDEILDHLLKEKAPEDGKTAEADVYSLILFGTTTIERLLDRLHDSQNRSERNRVVQLITRIGDTAVQPVVERLAQDGPWYYRRNLVLILGRIGDLSHMPTLERFLRDSDFRVQREAVLAVQNIGGRQAGDMLLNRLDDAADEVKAVIISVLGMMNYRQALPYLIMRLENRDLGKNREARSDINAKICEALARMGDDRALPLLDKIARSRSYLGIKTYDPKVKTAAARALAELERR